jgi:hypothetical protein
MRYLLTSICRKVGGLRLALSFELGGTRYTFDGKGLKLKDTRILNSEEMSQLMKLGLQSWPGKIGQVHKCKNCSIIKL